MNYIDLIEDYLNFAFISSIQIIKINEEYNSIFIFIFWKINFIEIK